MTMPKAYAPEDGYRYQILCRNKSYGNEWEHCDYAVNRKDRDYLMGEYSFSLSRLRVKSYTVTQKMLAENGSLNAPLKLEGYGNSG